MKKRVMVAVIFIMAALCLASGGLAEDYTYDASDRLTRIVYDDGTEINYTYDTAGNRIETEGTETVEPPVAAGGGGSNGLCFISTAAYDSYLE